MSEVTLTVTHPLFEKSNYTIGDLYNAVFAIHDPVEANTFYDDYIDWAKAHADERYRSQEGAETLVRANIGWIFGEGVAQQDAIIKILRSNEFRCVANERYEYVYHWDDPTWRNRPNRLYDANGRCMGMLTASVEREYKEMSRDILSSAIVFTGTCAELHGYKDDTANYNALSERYLERKQLLTQAEEALSNVT